MKLFLTWESKYLECLDFKTIKINGRGKPTPVAAAPILVSLVWNLPGKAAKEFRRQSAHLVCRYLGGDLTLVREIEDRYNALEPEEKEFLLENTRRNRELDDDERYYTRKRKYAQMRLESAQIMIDAATHEDKFTDIDIAIKTTRLRAIRDNFVEYTEDRRLSDRQTGRMSDLTEAMMTNRPLPSDPNPLEPGVRLLTPSTWMN